MRQLNVCYSFELGGEKKTKGAALTFVSAINAPCDEGAEHNSNLYSNRLPCPVVFDIGFSALTVYTIRNETQYTLCTGESQHCVPFLLLCESFAFWMNSHHCHLTWVSLD